VRLDHTRDIFTPMGRQATCDECEAIAQELREAYADAWIYSDQASRDALAAIHNMMGGTEEDAERAEALIPHARFRDPLRINRALKRKLAHQARSGHRVPWDFASGFTP
jgi:hypothetical protein